MTSVRLSSFDGLVNSPVTAIKILRNNTLMKRKYTQTAKIIGTGSFDFTNQR